MGVISHKHAYVSKAKIDFHEDSLERFVEQYTSMHTKLELTGFIVYRRGIFFHLLEGHSYKIEALMDSFRRDDRHTILQELNLPPTKTRVFPQWSMKNITDVAHVSIRSQERLQVRRYWDTMLAPDLL